MRSLLSEEVIAGKVRELGDQISRDYEGRTLHAICVLRGAFMFFADLVRELRGEVTMDFLQVGSYGAGTKSSGVVELLRATEDKVTDRHVLIVEDIVDSGRSMEFVRNLLSQDRPASLRAVALLSKPSRREIEVPVEYVGFEIPNDFVVGYGLDSAGLYRNQRYVGIVEP